MHYGYQTAISNLLCAIEEKKKIFINLHKVKIAAGSSGRLFILGVTLQVMASANES